MAGEHPSGLPRLAGRSLNLQYRPRRPEQAGLSRRIKEIAETRVRYGYRRIHVLLRREGWRVNVVETLEHSAAEFDYPRSSNSSASSVTPPSSLTLERRILCSSTYRRALSMWSSA
jgi:transposase InsO family protein